MNVVMEYCVPWGYSPAHLWEPASKSFGGGDGMVPDPRMIACPVFLGGDTIELSAYSVETAIAERLEQANYRRDVRMPRWSNFNLNVRVILSRWEPSTPAVLA
jgi:hypothetical protein